jgi:hypothetical protein
MAEKKPVQGGDEKWMTEDLARTGHKVVHRGGDLYVLVDWTGAAKVLDSSTIEDAIRESWNYVRFRRREDLA